MQRQQKNVVLCLLSLLISCGSLTSCNIDLEKKYPYPKIANCVHNDDYSAECTDLRKKPGEQVYTERELTNFICTPSDDYDTIYKSYTDIREKLIKAEIKIQQCKRW